jgi:hypothetical protein
MPVIPVMVGSIKQENLRSRPVWAKSKTLSQNNQRKRAGVWLRRYSPCLARAKL